MEHLQNLFSRYERILIFDTETTGLNFQKDEIIQFSAVLLEQQNGEIAVTQQYDRLIQLAPGQTVPPEIQRLTGITTEMVMTQGIPRQQAAAEIGALIGGNTLLTAYNAHFDLSFLYYLLARHGDPACLKGKDKLEDMIASIQHGYMLFETSNGMEDPKNWAIQCVAQYGIEIVDGKLTDNYVAPVVMSGYVPDLLKSISMISDDFEISGSGYCGKGYKEWVRVSDGGPALKVKVKLG